MVAAAALIGKDWGMLGWVAPTDYDWYRFLRERPEIREVNFWTPGGTNFRAVPAGSPFFFKLIGAMFLVTNDPFRSTFYSRAKCEEILQAK